ncbi:phosphatase PAP2 family protein [uncultured Tenacibaculum sp.]|uniref:phosphatase PAP2 family protein n=1 Tax=uncultured Tenacibaculum sp. TaxID=174713 RepID=UPI0026360D42|nr:phosphatase PAP2 family protein [uncultured Tenacibaculum sp.]
METVIYKKKTPSFSIQRFFNSFLLYVKSIRKEVLIIYFVFFLAAALSVVLYKKADLHLQMNRYHSSFFDVFFKYSTFLGDGIMFGVLTLLFLFVKRKMALVFMVGGFLTLLITHFFKKVVFKGVPRPAEFLGLENLHIIDGVKMAFWNSFPSGHTMTAFAIFAILCLYFRKCISQYVWVFLAVIAGFSRVYLSQHFLIDIFVGSILGVFIAFVSMSLFFPERKRIH